MDSAEVTKIEKFTEVHESQEIENVSPVPSTMLGRSFLLEGRVRRQYVSFGGRRVYPASGSTIVLGKLAFSSNNSVAFFELTAPANSLQLVVLLPEAPAEPLIWAIPLPYSTDLKVFWINEQRISVGPSLLEPTFSVQLSSAVSVR